MIRQYRYAKHSEHESSMHRTGHLDLCVFQKELLREKQWGKAKVISRVVKDRQRNKSAKKFGEEIGELVEYDLFKTKDTDSGNSQSDMKKESTKEVRKK